MWGVYLIVSYFVAFLQFLKTIYSQYGVNNKCSDILWRKFISHQEFGEIQLDEIQLLAKYNTSINNNQVRYFYLTLKNKNNK